uniref:Leukemia inhibitory factor receptor n=1 Tax=Pogona vitticeps TaxID=103695 RepID=A0A6J0TS08_9SAUR
MWINQIPCFLLAVAPFFILNDLVHSQKTESSYKVQNLTCVTHIFDEVICTWSATSEAYFSYKFCYDTSSITSPSCLVTEEKRQTLPLILFDSLCIEIFTLNSAGEHVAKNTFLLTEKNITLVPPSPHIERLTPNYISDTFELEWYDGGSAFPYEMDATWEIQILYKDPMEEVDRVTYNSRLNGSNTLLYWKWTSALPFDCTTHYVRIRCFLHDDAFVGKKTWSQWSEFVNIPGKDSGFLGGMYPIDRIVHVGSTVTFCCVWKKGEKIDVLNFSQCSTHRCSIASLSTKSMTIQVQNVSASSSSGSNAWCYEEPMGSSDTYGTVLFVGYPPDVPQNVNCETRDFRTIICTWEQGRSTELYGQRRTKYTLLERISGKNVTYTGKGKLYQCHFPILSNQRIYNFTVHALNDLGQSEASLSIDIKHRVHPQPPEKLTVSDNSPTNISLSWYLPGNFTEIKLKCQIHVVRSPSAEELNLHLDGTETSPETNKLHLNTTFPLDGAENSYYTVLVDNLLPYTSYTFQVRCSAAEPFFWKWSSWNQGKQHRTQEAPPAGQLDIWRERINHGNTVIIFWKSLPIMERNGKIEAYEVSWSLSKMDTEKQVVPEPNMHTSIDLGGRDCMLSVVATNKAGSSPPSLINSAEIAVDDVPTENAVATGDGVYITWHSDRSVTCGYTLRWCYGPEPCPVVDWKTFPIGVTNAEIKSARFQPGVRYQFFLYGCKDDGYQLLKHINGYIKELEPRVAPVFNIELTTSDSILIKWKDIPVADTQGFLKGYLLRFGKGEEGAAKPNNFESGHQEINITDLNRKTLKISKLQGKTSYHLNLSGYTAGGTGPASSLHVVTKENAVGLIIAILIPVAIVVVLAVVTSILCYRKREWIKETFYPDIPNPENCKALDFPKGPEGNPNSKTLEMNPCTPNNIEVVETQLPCVKIEDTAIVSPVVEELPEDGFDSESESHIVVSYCPSIVEEEILNPPVDGSLGSSQVVYIDVQTMYPAQVSPKEDLEVDCVAAAGYKPQMQLPVNGLRKIEGASSVEEDLDKEAGYRPQGNGPSWSAGCPDSPVSMESNNENASFGSPCSVNSRQFLIPSKEDEDSPKVINPGWSFTNFFHNKPND